MRKSDGMAPGGEGVETGEPAEKPLIDLTLEERAWLRQQARRIDSDDPRVTIPGRIVERWEGARTTPSSVRWSTMIAPERPHSDECIRAIEEGGPASCICGALPATSDSVKAGAAPDWLKLHAEGPGHHYSLDDCRAALVVGAAPRAEGLDVERLAVALLRLSDSDQRVGFVVVSGPQAAEAIAAEYARLSVGAAPRAGGPER